MSVAAAVEKVSYSSSDARQHRRSRACPDPGSTTPRKSAAKPLARAYRKYYNAHREAINARRAKRDRKRRAAIKAGQKET